MVTQAGFLGQKDSETSQGVQNTLPASAPLPKADNQHAASLVCSPRAASPPSGSMSGTRTTSHDPTYPQVKYHLGFAIADKLMGILRVKNHKILKLKGDNCINAKLSNAFCLLFHSKHLVLSQTHFTTCTELETETKFPVKDKRCSPSSEWGQTRRTKSFPAMRLGRSRAGWGTSHHGPSASHGWWQQRSISNSPEMLHCIGVQKGWDKILPHISPSIHQQPRTGWGHGDVREDQVRTGLPSHVPLRPSSVVTHLIPKLRPQLCAAQGFLCGQSPLPNTDSLAEKGKPRDVCGFLGSWRGQVNPVPYNCRKEQDKPSMA